MGRLCGGPGQKADSRGFLRDEPFHIGGGNPLVFERFGPKESLSRDGPVGDELLQLIRRVGSILLPVDDTDEVPLLFYFRHCHRDS